MGRRLLVPLCAAGALALAGCPKQGAGAADAGGAEANGSTVGVKVPLPPGWVASAGPEQTLLAGPRGRPVLRLERRPSSGTRLPTEAELKGAYSSGLVGAQIDRFETVRHPEASVLVMHLSATDGGERAGWVMIGARQVGGDLYLCSSLPGAAEAEVRAAAKTCAAIGG